MIGSIKAKYLDQVGKAMPAQEYYQHPKSFWVANGAWVFWPSDSPNIRHVSKSSLEFFGKGVNK